MTVKKVRNMWHHKSYDIYHDRRKNALASSYLSAALIALFFAAIVVSVGFVAMEDTIESYFEERPMINIILPSDV